MVKSNELTLKEAIKELLETYRLKDKLVEIQLIHAWDKVVGKMIAQHTKRIYINKKVLHVKLDSPALRHELSYAKTKIMEMLHKEVGEEVIKEIVFK